MNSFKRYIPWLAIFALFSQCLRSGRAEEICRIYVYPCFRNNESLVERNSGIGPVGFRGGRFYFVFLCFRHVSETQENKAKRHPRNPTGPILDSPRLFYGMSKSIVFHSTFALPRRVAINQAKKVLGNAIVFTISEGHQESILDVFWNHNKSL